VITRNQTPESCSLKMINQPSRAQTKKQQKLGVDSAVFI
jgi:hypothetical protein